MARYRAGRISKNNESCYAGSMARLPPLALPPRWILWLMAAFYAYGAAVHVANIIGLTGFSWLQAPLKWQVLDLVYLALDVVVAVGLLLRPRLGLDALILAALSQILLYSALRAWILDVPPEFAPVAGQTGYLDTLVWFHVACLATLAAGALWTGRRAD